MTTLTPCPMCGGLAEYQQEPGSWGYYEATHWVQCTGCGVTTPKIRSDNYDDGKAAAHAAWNRRSGTDGWRLEVKASELDNEMGVWACKDDASIWIAKYPKKQPRKSQ